MGSNSQIPGFSQLDITAEGIFGHELWDFRWYDGYQISLSGLHMERQDRPYLHGMSAFNWHITVGGASTIKYVALSQGNLFCRIKKHLHKLIFRRSTLAIVSADHFSRAFEKSQHPEEQFEDSAAKARAEQISQQSTYERFMTFGKENRYKIVGVSWVASMAVALTIVGRSPYLSTAQKLVQARVYAQGLTIAVLIATAVFEIGDRNKEEGRWETVKYVDPNDPEHKRLLEKKVHHERYSGEDQWRGVST